MSDKSCSFCGTKYTTPVCENCAEVFYPILNTLYKKQTNQESPLNEIDNLVFQGGGVLGICYLGVLKALKDEFISKVKRVAGTSAGSMCALYLGLGKTQAELRDLIYTKNFANLLDDGINLKVTWMKVNELDVTCKQVVFALLDLMKEQSSTKDPQSAIEKAVEIVTNVFDYLASKISPEKGAWIQAFFALFGDYIKKWIVGFLEKLFPNALESEQNQPDQIKSSQENFREVVGETFDKAANQIKTGTYVQSSNMAVLTSNSSPADQLKDPKILTYSLVELVWTFYFHPDTANSYVGFFSANKIKQELIIDPIAQSLRDIGRQDLAEVASELTFKELAELKNQKGELAFKPLYITAHNTSTLRTEVFSPDHTPYVVVADAVRASMSIPVFFKTVTISEKLPGQKPTPMLAYTSPSDKGTPILYVDGGLMDNYPIWIFDDLRYCIDGQIPQWVPNRRIEVQNPKSLGFRIMDKGTMDIYTKPYFDDEQRKLKATNGVGGYKNYVDIVKFFAQIYSPFTSQENSFVQLDEVPRTIYIDGMEVNTVDFSLDDTTKDKLIGSGEEAVRYYVDVRAKNSFKGEIGGYIKN